MTFLPKPGHAGWVAGRPGKAQRGRGESRRRKWGMRALAGARQAMEGRGPESDLWEARRYQNTAFATRPAPARLPSSSQRSTPWAPDGHSGHHPGLCRLPTWSGTRPRTSSPPRRGARGRSSVHSQNILQFSFPWPRAGLRRQQHTAAGRTFQVFPNFSTSRT